MSTLESIEQVAARFAPTPEAAPVPAEPVGAAASSTDESSGKGGTSSDPSLEPQTTTQEVAAEVVADVAPVVEPAPAAPKDPLSVKFGALARKEREIRAKESEFTQKMRDFEARQKDFETRQAAQPAKGTPKSPLDLLQEHGFKYADATEQVIRGWKAPEVDPLEERLKPLNERLSSVDSLAQEIKSLKDQLAAKEQATAYNQAMDEINEAVNSGQYEFVQALGDQAVDLVRDTIVEYYKVNQKMLDYSEACDIVERWYDENVVAPLLNTAKVKSRLAPQPLKPTPTQSTPPKEAKARTTLTNSLNSGGQATVDLDSMSKDDAIAHLAKKIKFIET